MPSRIRSVTDAHAASAIQGDTPHTGSAKKTVSHPAISAAWASSGMGRGSATGSTVTYFICPPASTAPDASMKLPRYRLMARPVLE